MKTVYLKTLEKVGFKNFVTVSFIQLQHLLEVIVSRNHLREEREETFGA